MLPTSDTGLLDIPCLISLPPRRPAAAPTCRRKSQMPPVGAGLHPGPHTGWL